MPVRLRDGTVVSGSSTQPAAPEPLLGTAEPMSTSLNRAKRVGAAALLPLLDTVDLVVGGREVGSAEPALKKFSRKLREYAYEDDPKAAFASEMISNFGAPAKAVAVGAGKALMAGVPFGALLMREGPQAARQAIDEAGGFVNWIKAYHGTGAAPFRKFSSAKVGTGEGAQVYGHGLYFAENPKVAGAYKVDVPHSQLVREFRSALPDNADFDEVMDLVGTGHFTPQQERVLKALEADDWLGFDYPSQAISAAYRNLDEFDPSPALREAVANTGSLYETRLRVSPEELLDWDKPLNQQPRMIEALKKAGLITGEKQFDSWTGLVGPGGVYINPADPGEKVYTAARQVLGEAEASAAFHKAGIPGHRYLDRGSRGRSRFEIVLDDVENGKARWDVYDSKKGGPPVASFGSQAEAKAWAAKNNPSEGTRNIVMYSDDKTDVISINGIPVEEFEARTGIKLASALAALGLGGAAASQEPR